ncbi:extracellular solute-binding protein, partial [Lichenifustis flavocetrariae]
MRRTLLALVVLAASLPGARAEDVKILSAAAVKTPLVAAQALAQAATGFDLSLDFGTAGAVRNKIAGGTPADVVVLPPSRLDELVKQGLVEAEGFTTLGTVGLGIAVKGGNPRPAIATETDIRTALVSAPSIGLADPASGATTGLYFAKLLKTMNLDEVLKPKIKLYSDGTAAMEALARGEVALAAGQISEIKPVAGVDLVGPLPDALQLRTAYAAGIVKQAHAPEAAKAMVAFLTSTKMAPVFMAAGFDPPTDPTHGATSVKLDPKQGDYIAPNFHFQSGETLAQLKLHYTTIGTPKIDAAGHVTNAVLALHGTTGTGQNFLAPSLADFLFGPGQPLDASKYFIIMPDGIGRGGSSKPSDGLRMKFPHYGYGDLVEAQHTVVVDGLHIDHLRLVLGTSMGGMHAWLWGERYPNMMDAIMPVASQPVAVTGRNYLWRDLIIQSIRTDPDWQNGDYVKEPTHFEEVLPIFTIMTGSPRVLEAAAPTQPKGNAYFDKLVADARAKVDADDYLYWFEAVADYNPEADLDKITARLFAVNFADDLLNPVQLGAMARVMP